MDEIDIEKGQSGAGWDKDVCALARLELLAFGSI